MMLYRDAFILSGSVDLRQKEVLEREIREAQQALDVIAVSYRELEQQDVALRQEDNRLRKEKVGVWPLGLLCDSSLLSE